MDDTWKNLNHLPTPHSACSTNCDLEHATIRAQILFGCYRKNDTNDPEIYISAVVATLIRYSQSVVDHITDPVTGLPSTMIFLPSIAEIREACDHRRNQERPATTPIPYRPEPPINRVGRLSYAELKAKYGKTDGTWGIDPNEKPAKHIDAKPSPDRKRYTYAEAMQYLKERGLPPRIYSRWE